MTALAKHQPTPRSDNAPLSRDIALHRFVPASPAETAACEELNGIFDMAVANDASDIHIEQWSDDIVLRMRVNGLMQEVRRIPTHFSVPLFTRLRQRAKIDTLQTRAPADGAFSLLAHGQLVSARVSIIPGLYGPVAVMRILYTRSRAHLDSLPFSDALRAAVMSALNKPEGLVLISGPTGSGKTTTLYAMLDWLNTPDRALSTVEDPVEYQVAGLRQVPVTPNAPFERILRALLRQDPDVLLVGEIRDRQTAQIAIQAANTGHLTLSSTHANSAVATISRLLNLGCEPYDVAIALDLVIAQRLLRRLCSCAQETPAGAPSLHTEWLHKHRFGEYVSFPFKEPHPDGCSACRGTGYLGRLPVFSALTRSNRLQEAIAANDHSQIEAAALGQALYEPLVASGMRLAIAGLIPLAAVMPMQSSSVAHDELSTHTPPGDPQSLTAPVIATEAL